jgi:hypothetical protein
MKRVVSIDACGPSFCEFGVGRKDPDRGPGPNTFEIIVAQRLCRWPFFRSGRPMVKYVGNLYLTWRRGRVQLPFRMNTTIYLISIYYERDMKWQVI